MSVNALDLIKYKAEYIGLFYMVMPFCAGLKNVKVVFYESGQ